MTACRFCNILIHLACALISSPLYDQILRQLSPKEFEKFGTIKKYTQKENLCFVKFWVWVKCGLVISACGCQSYLFYCPITDVSYSLTCEYCQHSWIELDNGFSVLQFKSRQKANKKYIYVWLFDLLSMSHLVNKSYINHSSKQKNLFSLVFF